MDTCRNRLTLFKGAFFPPYYQQTKLCNKDNQEERRLRHTGCFLWSKKKEEAQEMEFHPLQNE